MRRNWSLIRARSELLCDLHRSLHGYACAWEKNGSVQPRDERNGKIDFAIDVFTTPTREELRQEFRP